VSAAAAVVSLVGAGPGDPDLLTVRAVRRLREAEVILHDRLLDPAVLDLARPDAVRIDVGKGPGESWTQERINALLVEHGRAGRRVVRLKGGDPFLFGRGREEVDALVAAGLAWEVVPGVSSALAGPAAMGVPVTHRRVAATVTVVTCSRAAGEADPDWDALARLGGTIVVLMGAAARAEVGRRLVAGGLSPEVPVAAVTNASRPDQRVVHGRLADLGSLPIEAPAVIVVGEVARYAACAAEAAALAAA
jgi:uroporphyrin-III C-methyltransferase